MERRTHSVNWLFNQLKSRGVEDMKEFQRLLENEITAETKKNNLEKIQQEIDELFYTSQYDIPTISFVLYMIAEIYDLVEQAKQDQSKRDLRAALIELLKRGQDNVEKSIKAFINPRQYLSFLYHLGPLIIDGKYDLEKDRKAPMIAVIVGDLKVAAVKRHYRMLKRYFAKLKMFF